MTVMIRQVFCVFDDFWRLFNDESKFQCIYENDVELREHLCQQSEKTKNRVLSQTESAVNANVNAVE